MRLYKCDKTVLQFFPKAAAFLNGYTTNVFEESRTAFVDIQGKIVAVVHQHKLSEDEVHVIVENKFVERLLSHLKTYLSLSDTGVKKLEGRNIYWNLDTHELTVTDQSWPATVSEEEYTLYRVQNGVALQGEDYDQEMLLNLGDDSLISYTKGCYLGQEIIARVHYRGKPPKKLTVKALSECSPEQAAAMTSKVFDPITGEFRGFVFDKTGDDV